MREAQSLPKKKHAAIDNANDNLHYLTCDLNCCCNIRCNKKLSYFELDDFNDFISGVMSTSVLSASFGYPSMSGCICWDAPN